jgi:hypothetical protein
MKKSYLRYIVGTIFISLAIIVQIATIWAAVEFGTIDFASIIFHLNVPLDGTNMSPFISLIIFCVIGVATLGSLSLFIALKGRNQTHLTITIKDLNITFKPQKDKDLEASAATIDSTESTNNTDNTEKTESLENVETLEAEKPNKSRVDIKPSKKCFKFPIKFWNRFYVSISCVIFVLLFAINAHALALDTYIINQFKTSTLIEDEYVDPQNVELKFPEQKRNLIYILLESMEVSFSSPHYGGTFNEQLIPKLTELQLNNIGFTDNKNMLNGAYSPTGTTWSIAGLVAQTSGIPFLLPIGQNKLGKHSSFLPGAYSLGQVLEKEGYNQLFMLGSSAEFSGISDYLTQHGGYDIYDYNSAIEVGDIPEDYYVFWGLEDAKLYDFAKRELTELAGKDEPFSFTLFTIDTHFTEGYFCDNCSNKFGSDQYDNVIDCADRMLSSFLNWIEQQPFYENTTIVIAGDHPTMNNGYVKDHIDEIEHSSEYERKVYTTIINSAIKYTIPGTRQFATFDMYPTTLAAMGVQIPGNKLGLGTNLFSEEQTLIERFGIKYVNDEFSKVSDFYKDKILYGNK